MPQRIELKGPEVAALRRAMDIFTAKINFLQDIYGLPSNSQPTPDCKAFLVPDAAPGVLAGSQANPGNVE